MEQASLIYITESIVREIPLTPDKFLIGRDERNSFVINDKRISRVHCILEWKNGDWWISDESLNGTWLNEELMDNTRDHILADGDLIKLRDTIRFVYYKTNQNAEVEVDLLDTDISNHNAKETDANTNCNSDKADLNVISNNEFANSHHPAAVNIVQTAVPDHLTIAQSHKSVDAHEQAEPHYINTKPPIQPASSVNQQPKYSSSQEPSCSKDNSSILEGASKEVKQHQCELIAEKAALSATSACSNCTTPTPSSSKKPAEEVIEISSSDDDIWNEDDYKEDDYNDEDFYNDDDPYDIYWLRFEKPKPK